MLIIGYDLDHDYMTRYATIDADAFLSGSTEYTEMEFVGVKGRPLRRGEGTPPYKSRYGRP